MMDLGVVVALVRGPDKGLDSLMSKRLKLFSGITSQCPPDSVLIPVSTNQNQAVQRICQYKGSNVVLFKDLL